MGAHRVQTRGARGRAAWRGQQRASGGARGPPCRSARRVCRARRAARAARGGRARGGGRRTRERPRANAASRRSLRTSWQLSAEQARGDRRTGAREAARNARIGHRSPKTVLLLSPTGESGLEFRMNIMPRSFIVLVKSLRNGDKLNFHWFRF